MNNWKKRFRIDPTALLAKSDDIALRYSFETDILDGSRMDISDVWSCKAAQSIIRKQNDDGSWRCSRSKMSKWRRVDNDQYETFKKLADLVEKYRFTRKHTCIPKVADYFFSHQSSEGDIRGIYRDQYSPNYTAAILELLVKAGYAKDRRLVNSIEWRLGCRQHDGGWALAFRTKGENLSAFDCKDTMQPDLTMPSSHVITGVVLRALTVHPKYRQVKETKQAADLLADRIFTSDNYADRKSAEFWTRFAFPFVYTDLVSCLDSLSLIRFSPKHRKIQLALDWFESRQAKDGLINAHIVSGKKINSRLWLNLAICRIYKRLFT